MIQSMTGYGKSVLQLSSKKITIEIKSLNSKNLDLNVRLPSFYKEKEMAVRKKLALALIRGKIDFSIWVEMTTNETYTSINKGIVENYIKQLKEINNLYNTQNIEFLKMAINMPDALKTEREELDEGEWFEINNCINTAIEEIIKYRKDEAVSLEIDFKKKIKNIQTNLEEIKKIDNQRVENVKKRLKKSIDDLKIEIDNNRFEQELIYYIEKLDINEEKVRLKNHLEYFSIELNNEISNGKKLGFIIQEIGREINTIGSKANFAPMQKIVIKMKNELEKIKEQILNIL